MGFMVLLAIWATTFIIAQLIRPKLDFEDAKPDNIGDFKFPTATEGRVVPLVWGRIRTDGPNVLWYGEFGKWAITESISTGWFSSETVIKGYSYFISIQFGICRGPDVSLWRIWVGDKETNSWVSGNTSTNRFFIGLTGGDDNAGIMKPYKMRGYASYYDGSLSQVQDAYLWRNLSNSIPAYRGTCHLVYKNWHYSKVDTAANIGTTTSVEPFAFEVQRIPDGLNLAGTSPGDETPHVGGANPMNVLYEIFTDTDWGLGISSSVIDVANWRTVAGVLATEGNGFAMILDSPTEAVEIINEIGRQIDGMLFFNRETALWQMNLARDDYVASSLTVYDEDSIIELDNFSRISWQDTSNQVSVSYADLAKEYQDTYALAQDTANITIQGYTSAVDISFPGVKNGTLANDLAWRELATLAYPLSKINFTINRAGFDLTPGDVFRFSWDRLGIVGVVYRIIRINYGTIEEGKIEISAIEDIFSVGVGAFGVPPGTGWVDPDDQPAVPSASDILTFEAPRQLTAIDKSANPPYPVVYMAGRDPGGVSIGFQTYSRFAASRPLTALDFEEDSFISGFILQGALTSALTAYPASTDARPATTYDIEVDDVTPDDLSELEEVGNESSVSSLKNIVYIDNEFIGYETTSAPAASVVTLTRIYRGLFNSVPADHAEDAPVWFVGATYGNISTRAIGDGLYEMDVQLRASNGMDETTEAATVVTEVEDLTVIHNQPLPPRDPQFEDVYAPSTTTIDTSNTSGTGLTGDDARAVKVEVTPRAWRTNNVLEDHILTATAILELANDNTEWDFNFVLDPAGTPLTTEIFNISATSVPIVYITRNAFIVAAGSNNPIHGTGKLVVSTSHTPDTVGAMTAARDMEHTLTITSALQSADDLTFGGIVRNATSDAVVFGETGTYAFDIKTTLPSSGIVEVNVNAGGWVTLVAASATTGNVSITAADSVEIRFDQYPANDQFFDITGPTAELGYGVLLAL